MRYIKTYEKLFDFFKSDVRFSNDDKTIQDRMPLVRLFMRLTGTLPERVFDKELGKWKALDLKTGE